MDVISISAHALGYLQMFFHIFPLHKNNYLYPLNLFFS